MPILDLSHEMTPTMTVWPGDVQPSFQVSCSFDTGENCRSTLISFTTHTGTHVDAFSHILRDGKTMDEIPVTQFFGKAIVIDGRDLGPDGVFTPEMAEAHPDIEEAEIILFDTGWEDKFNTRAYENHYPVIGEALAAWLVEHKKYAVGVNSLSIDPTESFEMPAHQILMSGGVVIYENLCNLKDLPKGIFRFQGLPLKLHGLDASPTRAIAMW